MADYVDYDMYENMIEALHNFAIAIDGSCDDMKVAVDTCVTNLEEDAHALKAASRLGKNIQLFEEIAELAKKVADDMGAEREQVMRRGRSL